MKRYVVTFDTGQQRRVAAISFEGAIRLALTAARRDGYKFTHEDVVAVAVVE